ncbi:hypothetical protein ACEQ8H_006953 [Pleosporales sp. CAS-2024a]
MQPATNPPSRAQDSAPTPRWRFGRSATSLRDTESPSSSIVGPTPSMRREPAPVANAPKMDKSASKMSLFHLFSKPKVERARGHTEVGLAVPMSPQTPPKPQPVLQTSKSSLRQNPSPAAQQSIRARSSQRFRPISMRPPPPPHDSDTWEPPPLFQAFSQSVKHATLQACVFAPEILMRTQGQRRQAEVLKERMDSARDLSSIEEDGSDAKRLEKTHNRLISNSLLHPPAPDLVNKIYMLVTAGYVLQYAGDGPFDRAPEKMLKLGKESAAWACDLIPGKHWVLQISSHAHDDGTTEAGPKNSLLSRLRTQKSVVRKAASSFLLVLDSAEEMDAWMTVVRKEIDNQGGAKVRDEACRASFSTDDTRETRSSDTLGYRHRVQRDSKSSNKIAPVDSPFQSQYSSPRIVASDWASSNCSERTVSITESVSGQVNKNQTQRQSMETTSMAATPLLQDQMQRDSLRNATFVSGPGTRSTSRESSPAPKSPYQETFSPAVEAEPTRSAMSLKSFHMNPSNSVASRRRSMQPLPVTKEHFAPPVDEPALRYRHSHYGVVSPRMAEQRPGAVDKRLSVHEPATKATMPIPEATKWSYYNATRSTRPQIQTDVVPQAPVPAPTQLPAREENFARLDTLSYSIPPRSDAISPPPKEPAPLPPASVARRQSSFGAHLATVANTAPSPTSDARSQRRISATPKPFIRPFPVRPQQQHTDQSRTAKGRRLSSYSPPAGPAPLRLGMHVNRSVTSPVRPPSSSMNMGIKSNSQSYEVAEPASQPRRQSVQGRTSPAPFLLAPSRPVRAIASTPSFVPSRRTSNPPVPPPTPPTQQPSSSALREHIPAQFEYKFVATRRSMPLIGLPPPVPPPNVPLPTLPPSSLPSTTALPLRPSAATIMDTSPNMPLSAPPPSVPLPPTPPQAQPAKGVSV